jgi:hypothetical protein
LYVTDAATASFDGFLSVNVVPVIVAEFIGWLNVALTLAETPTPVAALAGETAVTVGGLWAWLWEAPTTRSAVRNVTAAARRQQAMRVQS